MELQILFNPSQNVLPSQYFFVETDEMILFFFPMKYKGLRIAKTISKKKNRVERFPRQMAKLKKWQQLSQYGVNTNFCQLKHKDTQTDQ